jgi:hypothetical protein
MVTHAIDTNFIVELRKQVEIAGSIERLRLVDAETDGVPTGTGSSDSD